MSRVRPNPGSDEAIELGCICAVLDNNHGKYAPYQPDGWWITAGCPLHGDAFADSDDDYIERWETNGGAV